MSTKPHQRGLSLVEVIVFIVIVSVALTGVLTVFNHTVRHSADPMARKQALAIAEAILEEVMLQPFTWCDPNDANAATATSAALGAGTTLCATTVEASGAEGAEARGTFDNVNDYHGLSTTTNIAGGGAASYTATVSVAGSALNGIAASEALLITVSVAGASETIELQGYRTRYAPNQLP